MLFLLSGYIAGVPAAPKGENTAVSPLKSPCRPPPQTTLICSKHRAAFSKMSG